MKHRYLPLILPLLCLFACGTPLQVVRVDPAAEQDVDRYRYGNPVQALRQGDILVEISYYDASADYLVFDAEVINESQEELLFDPADAYLLAGNNLEIPAVDPEFELLSMDLETVRQQRSARTLAWVGTAVMVAASVYSIASANTPLLDVPAGASVVADVGVQVADAMTFAVLSRDQQLFQRNTPPAGGEIPTPANRYFWLDYSFRKTTLRPGESAVGKLVFPRLDEQPRFDLVVPVTGRELFPFSFTQRIFRERR